MSPELARFYDKLRQPELREDAYDTSDLRTVAAAERDQAVHALLMLLKRQDPRAAMALAELGEAWVAPELQALATGAGPLAAVARRALVRLGVMDAATAEGLAQDTRAGTMFQRFGAVMELAKVPGREAHDALMAALDDDDPLVRSQAYEALVTRLGLLPATRTADGSDVNLRSPLEVMHLLVRAEAPTLRALGLMRLRRAFMAAEAGRSASDIGLDFAGDPDEALRHSIGKALRNPGAAYPVDLVKGAAAHDRAFAEAIWAVALGRADARAPAALAAVGATWALPTLVEARAKAADNAAFVAAVDLAMASLAPTA